MMPAPQLFGINVQQTHGHRPPHPRPSLLTPIGGRIRHPSTVSEARSVTRDNDAPLPLPTVTGGGLTDVSELTVATTPTMMEHQRMLQHIRTLESQIELSAGSTTREKEVYSVKHHVMQTAKRELFRKIKFIVSDKMLDDMVSPHSIACHIFRTLNVPHARKARFWATYRNTVFRTIVDQRSNVMAQIKKAWFGKSQIRMLLLVVHVVFNLHLYSLDLYTNNRLPPMKEIFDMRNQGVIPDEDNPFFFYTFLSLYCWQKDVAEI